ncbi:MULTISPECIES: CGNR zinc finger domain-containing protein [unclassified Streptomyces]|uniref:CGNR zinc finger domain-containing protein n=1 Tax=unclassified Streptomyces TaxID=2593676 RepID=UPI00331D27BC
MSESEPLTGEALALDLVNTRPLSGDGRVDLLGTPRQLSRWLALEADRLGEGHTAEGGAGEEPGPDDLGPVHAVRGHTEHVVQALLDGAEPPAAALRGLTEAQRAAPAVRELRWDGTSVTAGPRRTGPLGVRLAAALAEAAADLLTDPAIGRLKECEADGCVMVFLPAHPRRRWCSPARCGNRARVARYYQRHNTVREPKP